MKKVLRHVTNAQGVCLGRSECVMENSVLLLVTILSYPCPPTVPVQYVLQNYIFIEFLSSHVLCLQVNIMTPSPVIMQNLFIPIKVKQLFCLALSPNGVQEMHLSFSSTCNIKGQFSMFMLSNIVN